MEASAGVEPGKRQSKVQPVNVAAAGAAVGHDNQVVHSHVDIHVTNGQTDGIAITRTCLHTKFCDCKIK